MINRLSFEQENFMKIQELLEAKKNAVEILQLSMELQNELKRMPEGKWADIREPEMMGKRLMADIRYWGEWEMPEGEEDDGDYDWKRLSRKSSQAFDKKVKEFEKEHKVKVDWETSEKEFISFFIS